MARDILQKLNISSFDKNNLIGALGAALVFSLLFVSILTFIIFKKHSNRNQSFEEESNLENNTSNTSINKSDIIQFFKENNKEVKCYCRKENGASDKCIDNECICKFLNLNCTEKCHSRCANMI